MDSIFGIFVVLFALFVGSILGYSAGKANEQKAIAECEKALPRNVNCTIIAVPVDKN
jgi:hypothetical protein